MDKFQSARLDNEPWLLTPGPLTTSAAVKKAMQRDWGSWDQDFCKLTAGIRAELLDICSADSETFACVPMQGSGTFVVEAMLGSLIPQTSKTLVLINGAYGKRVVTTLQYLKRQYTTLDKGDYLPPRANEVGAILDADPDITHVVVVHCETSSGILNPIEEISKAVYERGRKLLIDSMSAFGALPINSIDVQFEALVSSANKCIEGVPGFGFVIAKISELQEAQGRSHSLSLDLYEQWQHMEKTGQWRFTPPTHSIAAFAEALAIHCAEGGTKGRLERYTQNRDTLVAGMRNLGFETLLTERWLSPIIVTFFTPQHCNFSFAEFYAHLKAAGFIIYPGKLTVVDSFRIGCIGHLDHHVMQELVSVVDATLQKMKVDSAIPPAVSMQERSVLTAATA